MVTAGLHSEGAAAEVREREWKRHVAPRGQSDGRTDA